MKNKTFKQLTAVLVAAMMVFSMCITGVSVSAATSSDATGTSEKTIYFVPSSTWQTASPRYAAYVWDDSGNTWFDLKDSDGDGYYEANIPSNYQNIIFVRMDPAKTENSWSSKWNQSADLTLPTDSKNCFTLSNGTWDDGNGTWSQHDAVVPTTAEPTTVAPTTVAPTTAAPTTVEPTTVAPTTAAPTTVEPTTAAKTGVEVSATSNVFPTTKQTFDASANTVTVTYYLQCSKRMLNSQWTLKYDPTVLQFNASKNETEDGGWSFMPVASDAVCNPYIKSSPGTIKGNCTNLNLYKLTASDGGKVAFVTVTFDVIGSGSTAVDLQLEVMQIADLGSSGIADFDTVEDFVNNSQELDISTTMNKYTSVTSEEEPTTAPVTEAPTTAPVTEAPTTAPVTEPTTAPASSASVFGDINLELAKESDDVYTASTELEKGTYTFRINNNGTTYCNGSTFTDSTTNAAYNAKWKSATTLVANGGTYTFKYNVSTNKLTIEYQAPSLAQIFGDINLDLQATKDANIYSAAVELESGSYDFRVMNQDTQYCCKYTYSDITVGSKFYSKYTGASTLKASGGTYTFSYDIEANKLTISYLPKGAAVSVIGDFTLSLQQTDNENVYTATQELKAGSYVIKVNNFGKICGGSATVTDAKSGIVLNPKWTSYTTLKATGGTYTFTYDVSKNVLSIAYAK